MKTTTLAALVALSIYVSPIGIVPATAQDAPVFKAQRRAAISPATQQKLQRRCESQSNTTT